MQETGELTDKMTNEKSNLKKMKKSFDIAVKISRIRFVLLRQAD
jgi:hypothetical protein